MRETEGRMGFGVCVEGDGIKGSSLDMQKKKKKIPMKY